MAKKTNNVTVNNTVAQVKEEKTMATTKKVTTNKAQAKEEKVMPKKTTKNVIVVDNKEQLEKEKEREQINAEKANARASIEKILEVQNKYKDMLKEKFTNGKFDTFDFSKLERVKVLDVFTDKGFMSVIRVLYDANEALESYEAAYPGYVAEIKKALEAKVKAEKEARKKIVEELIKDMPTEEAAKVAELLKGKSYEDIAKALGKDTNNNKESQ